MNTSTRAPKSIATVAVLLAIPGLIMSQIAPFSSYASILWLASGIFLAIALISAIRMFRTSKGK